MDRKRDNLLFYAFIGVGYLLCGSVLPSLAAVNLAGGQESDLNLYYAGLSLLMGMLYVFVIFRMKRERIGLFEKLSLAGLGEALITALVLFILINFVVSPVLGNIFPVSAGNYDSNVESMMQTPVATFLQVVLVAPLLEELVFRGFIMKRMVKQGNPVCAVFVTAMLFGILHMSIVQGLSAAAAGIVLCVFYLRRNSVGLNIIAHSIYNGMVFLLAFLVG